MPLQKLQFKPGLNRDQTNYTNEGGWYECDKIRFRSGMPQKIGGWAKFMAAQLLGVSRQMFNYITTSSDNLLAIGTNKKLYVVSGQQPFDITPLRATFNPPTTNNCFTTASVGTTTVLVTINGHGASNGDYVTFSGAQTFAGIPVEDLNKNHEISNVTTNTFTITVATLSTAAATGGGVNIVAKFDIPVGAEITFSTVGWGAGAWGAGSWGTSVGDVSFITLQRDWWFDNFDQDLVCNIREGTIYYWAYDNSFSTRAVPLSSLLGAVAVPNKAMQILVSQGDKHLLAFGCQPYGGLATDYDPLLIRWASQDAPEIWEPLITNSAGFLRVNTGSRIIRAQRTRQETLVWTESSLNSLQFLGTSDVFGLTELADNISIIGPRTVATANNTTYWMGRDKFYVYSGRVETLPCSLRNHVFQNINYDQTDQIVCGTNEGWNEVWWIYPSAGSLVNDSYVIYNYLEQVWYYGTINKTAWLDTPLQPYPISYWNGYVFNQEFGCDADGQPLEAYIQSSDVDLMDGEEFMLTRRIIPDLNFEGSTVSNPTAFFTLRPRNFPGANYLTEPELGVQRTTTVPIEQYTNQVFIRARARQMGLKVSSTGLGVQWQLGSPRLEGRKDGKR
jgi:hypothetical protein